MEKIKNREEPLTGLPYRFRYRNGTISRGGFKTFEAAVKSFSESKKFGGLYHDLKDVICIEERELDYLKGV